MIEEVGTVISIHSLDIVEVETVRTSSCQACKAKSACGHHAIAQVSSTNRMRVFAKDSFSSRVGETVTIGIPEESILSASILMYLIPLIGLMIGATVSSIFTDQVYLAVLFSIFGLVSGLWIARKQSIKHQSNPNFHPRVLRLHRSQQSDIPVINF